MWSLVSLQPNLVDQKLWMSLFWLVVWCGATWYWKLWGLLRVPYTTSTSWRWLFWLVLWCVWCYLPHRGFLIVPFTFSEDVSHVKVWRSILSIHHWLCFLPRWGLFAQHQVNNSASLPLCICQGFDENPVVDDNCLCGEIQDYILLSQMVLFIFIFGTRLGGFNFYLWWSLATFNLMENGFWRGTGLVN